MIITSTSALNRTLIRRTSYHYTEINDNKCRPNYVWGQPSNQRNQRTSECNNREPSHRISVRDGHNMVTVNNRSIIPISLSCFHVCFIVYFCDVCVCVWLWMLLVANPFGKREMTESKAKTMYVQNCSQWSHGSEISLETMRTHTLQLIFDCRFTVYVIRCHCHFHINNLSHFFPIIHAFSFHSISKL